MRVFILDIFLRYLPKSRIILRLHNVTLEYLDSFRFHLVVVDIFFLFVILVIHYFDYYHLFLLIGYRRVLGGMGRVGENHTLASFHLCYVSWLGMTSLFFLLFFRVMISRSIIFFSLNLQHIFFQKPIWWGLDHSHWPRILPNLDRLILEVELICQVNVAEILVEVLPLSLGRDCVFTNNFSLNLILRNCWVKLPIGW